MTQGWIILLSVLTAGADPSEAQPTPDAAPPALHEAPPLPPPAAPERDPAFHNTPPGCFGDRPDLCTAFWLRGDYLLWWTKKGPFPDPLVTTGSPTSAVPGGLTQPGTRVLFGESEHDYGGRSGLALDGGMWLDYDQHWGVDFGYFNLERRLSHFAAASDAAGSPLLAQPLIDPKSGLEFTELISLPGVLAGATAITSDSHMEGWNLTGTACAYRTDNFNVDVQAGLRVLSLAETLEMASDLVPLVGGALTFPGQTVSTASSVVTLDRFAARSVFYGAQFGGRAEWNSGRLTLIARGYLSLGDTQELLQVVGRSSLLTPGAPTVNVPGGVLAVSSNLGRHFQDEFGVVPELNLEVSYRITCNIEAHLGYSFLYWNRVARPGNQIDRVVEPALVPTDPLFGTATGTRPGSAIRSSDFWAQGLNVGLMFRF